MSESYRLGRENYINGNLNKALLHFNKANEEEPNNIDYLYALGNTYSLLYESDIHSKKALNYYERVLKIDPNNIKAIIHKSLILLSLGKIREALDFVESALITNNGPLWAVKGRILSYSHNYNNEIIKNCFDKAYELSKDTSYVDFLLARTYQFDLEYEKAEMYYDKSIEGLDDSHCDLDDDCLISKFSVMLMKAWMYFSLNKFEESLEIVDEILSKYKRSISALYLKALILAYYQDLDEALNLISIILSFDSEDIATLILQATIFAADGSIRIAENVYKKILDIDSSNGLALMNLSGLYYEEKNYNEAFNLAKQALEIEPYNAFALYVGSRTAKKLNKNSIAHEWEFRMSNHRVNQIFLEKNLQDKIINEDWRLKKAGYDLIFQKREFTLEDRPGRIDILFKDAETDDYLVVELKVVPADKAAYNQIKNYMDSVNQTVGFVKKEVKGLIISFGYNDEFKRLVDKDPKVSQINYDKLGLY